MAGRRKLYAQESPFMHSKIRYIAGILAGIAAFALFDAGRQSGDHADCLIGLIELDPRGWFRMNPLGPINDALFSRLLVWLLPLS
jgi:hypothetical protein